MKRYCFLIFLFAFFIILNLQSQEKINLQNVRNEFRRKNFQAVIRILEGEKIKENPELLYYLGISHYNIKNYEKAKNYIEDLIFKTEIEEPYILNESLRAIFDIYRQNRNFDDIIKIGEYVLKKIENKQKFSSSIPIIKNNLSFAYREIGNIYLRNRNFNDAISNLLTSLNYNPDDLKTKNLLGEAYYSTENYEKAKEMFIDVIKNEKNNFWILIPSIAYYREMSEQQEREKLLTFLQENHLSYKIFKSFEMFSTGNYEEGLKILKEEEIKKNTNGDITFNIISRIFPCDFSSYRVYLNFIKFFPESTRNTSIIMSLFRAITDEGEQNLFVTDFENIIDEIAKDEKKKDIIVNFYMNIIEGKFERKLSSIDDYIEKIKEYEKLIEKYPESKYKEEILKRIGDLYSKIDEYDKVKEIYKKIAEEFKKEEYNLKIAESYFKEGDLEKAEEIVNNFLLKDKNNHRAKLLLSKIYIEKRELDKAMEIIYDIVKNSKDRDILREIENLKSNIFEAREILEEGILVFLRRFDNYSTRLVPPDEILFLNQQSKEIEFYPFSEQRQETEFKLKYKIDQVNSLTQPYVMISNQDGKYFYLWEDKVVLDKNKYRQKNIYKVFYPVKEIASYDFKFNGNVEVVDNNYILNLNFTFFEDNWELIVKNYRNYGELLQIEPLPEIQDRNLIVWHIKNKSLNIKIFYRENKNLIYYFPEIEIRKKSVTEKQFQPESKEIIIDNFELKIENFVPSFVKLIEEYIKIYNFSERIYRK
ncbi:MAG: tetratricopeptide repeat protein [Candidatus Omnitrophica bacterium]|nr:tetratricopeptide repeat protein [Candidatus Omnitrophota bacterium]